MPPDVGNPRDRPEETERKDDGVACVLTADSRLTELCCVNTVTPALTMSRTCDCVPCLMRCDVELYLLVTQISSSERGRVSW